MEGDPLIPLGLEYLFGFVHVVGDRQVFVPFWGHTREEERKAFEQAMDFMTAQLAAFPDAHVYHYAKYEESALKRLAMMHGTREAELDNLLRAGKLVDLYRVVREAIQVSEPRYSIKNLETFYMPPRSGEVKSADASIVVYEQWRQLQDPKLLQEIADYNEEDCRSTLMLRDWLLSLKPVEVPWNEGKTAEELSIRNARRDGARRKKGRRKRLRDWPKRRPNSSRFENWWVICSNFIGAKTSPAIGPCLIARNYRKNSSWKTRSASAVCVVTLPRPLTR